MTWSSLKGFLVLETTQGIAGAACGRVLADLGADVLLVEQPGQGHPLRALGPFRGGVPDPEGSGMFVHLNTNKLSAAINWKCVSGRILFHRLARMADCWLHDLTPRQLRQAGLSPRALLRLNPRLVVTSITPFGSTGSKRNHPATELTVYHSSGMGSLTRQFIPEERRAVPVKQGFSLAAYAAGLNGAAATLVALYARAFTGKGQTVDVSARESLAAMLHGPLAELTLEGTVAGEAPAAFRGSSVYGTRDGRQVMIGAPGEHQWVTLIRLLGNPPWAADEWWRDFKLRSERAEFLHQQVGAWAARHDQEELIELGIEHHFPVARVNTPGEVLSDPQLASRGFFVTAEHPRLGPVQLATGFWRTSAGSWMLRRPAPRLGEHTGKVLVGWLGYNREDIVNLVQSGVIV